MRRSEIPFHLRERSQQNLSRSSRFSAYTMDFLYDVCSMQKVSVFLVHAPCPTERADANNLASRHSRHSLSLSLSVSLFPCLPLSLEPALYKNRLRLAVNVPASSSSHSNAAVSLSTREPVRCTRQKREKECDRFSYSFQGDRENQLLPGCCASRRFISR